MSSFSWGAVRSLSSTPLAPLTVLSQIIASLFVIGFFLVNIIMNTGRYKQCRSSDREMGSNGNLSGIKSFQLKMRRRSHVGDQPLSGLDDNTQAVQLSVTDFDMVHRGDSTSEDEKEKGEGVLRVIQNI